MWCIALKTSFQLCCGWLNGAEWEKDAFHLPLIRPRTFYETQTKWQRNDMRIDEKLKQNKPKLKYWITKLRSNLNGRIRKKIQFNFNEFEFFYRSFVELRRSTLCTILRYQCDCNYELFLWSTFTWSSTIDYSTHDNMHLDLAVFKLCSITMHGKLPADCISFNFKNYECCLLKMLHKWWNSSFEFDGDERSSNDGTKNDTENSIPKLTIDIFRCIKVNNFIEAGNICFVAQLKAFGFAYMSRTAAKGSHMKSRATK